MKKELKKKLAIFIPVGLVFALLLTGGIFYFTALDLTVNPYDNLLRNKEQIIASKINAAFKESEEKKSFNFELSQEDLNMLFAHANRNVAKEGSTKYFFVDITDKKYTFSIGVDFGIIKSRIIIDTTLSESDDEFEFDVNNVSLGHLGARNMLKGYLSKVPFEDVFKEIGLSISVDCEHSKLIYKKTLFYDDVRNLIIKNDNKLYSNLMNELDYEISLDGDIKATSSFSDFISNELISDSGSDSHHYENYVKIKEKIKDIKAEILASPTKDQDTYDTCFNKLKDVNELGEDVDNLVTKAIKTNPASTYADMAYAGQVASINEKDLDLLLNKSSIIGKNYVNHYEGQLSYICVDKMYVDIYSVDSTSYMSFTIGLNVNGLETRAIIETIGSGVEESFNHDFVIENVYFGSSLASESFKTFVIDLFDEALSSLTNSLMEFNKEVGLLTFNFDKSLEKLDMNDYKVVFFEMGGYPLSNIKNISVSSLGSIDLYYSH